MCIFAIDIWTLSSAGQERSPHTRKVAGSNPVASTTNQFVLYLN